MLTIPASVLNQRICFLETTGRVTGRAHHIEIWFAADPDDGRTLYMLAGGRNRADWVRNVRANPEVSVHLNDVRYRGKARIIESDDPNDLRAREVVAAKYQGWQPGREFSEWARNSLPVVIYLEGDTP